MWVAGAYRFDQHYRQPVFTTNPQQTELNGPFPFFPKVFCPQTGGVCAPGFGFRRFDNRPEVNARSEALFGQIDWAFAPRWEATLGVRYSRDRKQGTESVRILCFAVPDCYGGLPSEFFPLVFGGTQAPAVDPLAIGIAG